VAGVPRAVPGHAASTNGWRVRLTTALSLGYTWPSRPHHRLPLTAPPLPHSSLSPPRLAAPPSRSCPRWCRWRVWPLCHGPPQAALWPPHGPPWSHKARQLAIRCCHGRLRPEWPACYLPCCDRVATALRHATDRAVTLPGCALAQVCPSATSPPSVASNRPEINWSPPRPLLCLCEQRKGEGEKGEWNFLQGSQCILHDS
jgi:hypothetical protein